MAEKSAAAKAKTELIPKKTERKPKKAAKNATKRERSAKNTVQKRNNGAKNGSKAEQWLTDDGKMLCRAFMRDGHTDEELAEYIGISTATLYRWKNKYPDFAENIKTSKAAYDVTVEESLHRRTVGFKVAVKKHFKIKTTKLDKKTGRRYETEELVAAEDEVYIPADTTAQIFWLCNRLPERWRRQQIDTSAPESERDEALLLQTLAAASKATDEKSGKT